MIAVIVSAIKGPILSVLSGCLGESDLGNDSHFRNIFGIDTSKDSSSYRETTLPSIFFTSRGTADYAWIRSRRHAGHLRLTSSNGPA